MRLLLRSFVCSLLPPLPKAGRIIFILKIILRDTNKGQDPSAITAGAVDEITPLFPPRSLPCASEEPKYIKLAPDQYLIITSDNRKFLTDRSSSPLGSITTRFELDRVNNLSRTEILTNYPENRFDLTPQSSNIPTHAPDNAIPSTASDNLREGGHDLRNITRLSIPENIYNKFRFNIEHISDEALAKIIDKL